MNPAIDRFFESQPARWALVELFNMALHHGDTAGADEIAEGIHECDLIIQHFEACLALPSV